MTVDASRAADMRQENVGTGPERQQENEDYSNSQPTLIHLSSKAQDGFMESSESPQIIRSAKNFDKDVQFPLLETSQVSNPRFDPDVTQAEVEMSDDDDDGVPYDRGWAWMVVLGQFVNMCLMAGYLRSSSLIFVELLRQFNASVTHAALLFGISSAVFSVWVFYVMNVLFGRVGSRTLALTGGILMPLSAILSSLASNLTLFILLRSVLLGMGLAMLTYPGEVLVGTYFKKRRSLALALTKCGTSVGNVAVPPLITFLLANYGLTGTLLLYGAICLHSVPAALLFRPVSYFIKQHARRPYHRNKSGLNMEKPSNDDLELQESDLIGCRDDATVLPTAVRKHKATEKTSAITATVSHRDSELFLQTKDKVNERALAVRDSANPESFVNGTVDLDQPLQNLSTTSKHVMITTEAPGYPKLLPDEVENQVSSFCRSNSERMSSKYSDSNEDEEELVLANSHSVRKFVSTASTAHQPFSKPLEEKPRAQKYTPVGVVDKISGQNNVVKLVPITSADLTSASVITRPSPNATELELNGTVESVSCGNKLKHYRTNVENHGDFCSCRKVLRNVILLPQKCLLMFDFSLFRNPLFRILFLFAITSPLINITATYLPAAVMEKGLSESQAALLLSIIGAFDFVSHLSCGVIVDLKVLRAATVMTIAYVVLGIMVQFLRFMTSFEHFVVLAVLQGMFAGAFSCLLPIIVIDFVGLKNMGKALGFTSLVGGASMAGVFPFLGYIRDLTGSYVIVYHVIGCGILLSAGFLSLERPLRRLEKKKRCEERENNGSEV